MIKEKTQKEWKEVLPPEVYHILWEKGTEPPFTEKSNIKYHDGVFICSGCGNRLFKLNDKYDSGSGWPSFYNVATMNSITQHTDESFGMKRIEVRCKNCGGHLGHVFDDGPLPTKKRYCINSLALKFEVEK